MTTKQRGYDADHQAQRKHLAPIVARGEAWCWRCGQWIQPDTPWDAGHDGTFIRKPEHRYCNRAAGARNARRKQRRRKRIIDYSARW